MNNSILNQIETLENKIKDQEQNKSKLEGKKESIEEKLKNDFSITNLHNISNVTIELETEAKELENQINNKLSELQDKWEK